MNSVMQVAKEEPGRKRKMANTMWLQDSEAVTYRRPTTTQRHPGKVENKSRVGGDRLGSNRLAFKKALGGLGQPSGLFMEKGKRKMCS